MNRDRFEIYWSYYLSIEKMLENTNQYVSPVKVNKKTYANEFTKIILLSCSEIDSILKCLCSIKKINSQNKYYTMSDYAKVLLSFPDLKEMGYCPFYNTSLNEYPLDCYPFSNIIQNMKYANLKWWENYQKIKHNRIEFAHLGNLETAVNAVMAHYIILRFAIDFMEEKEGKEYVKNNNISKYFVPIL